MTESALTSRNVDVDERWTTVFGKLPKEEIRYFCQVVAIYIILIVCLINLSLGSSIDSLWSSLLSGSVGYLLPAPKLAKKKHDTLLLNAAE